MSGPSFLEWLLIILPQTHTHQQQTHILHSANCITFPLTLPLKRLAITSLSRAAISIPSLWNPTCLAFAVTLNCFPLTSVQIGIALLSNGHSKVPCTVTVNPQ